MGSVRKYLYQGTLSEREKHHSRLFIDLAENIHIHHREYRTVFSLDEYFEYADIVAKSTIDVRNYLEQNSGYKEKLFPTTIMIAGGKERQLKFLKNSPKPNASAYFSNNFAIELQDEYVTDEIHIHYRDFRIAMDRVRFREFANGFRNALASLDEFEKTETYNRESHSDRVIKEFNADNQNDIETEFMGATKVSLDEISSNWYENIESEWKPNKEAISLLMREFKKNGRFTPVILSTEKDGSHLIIDGHHRFFAALKLNINELDAIIVELKFSDTEKIRAAEVLLKEFDLDTKYKYSLSSFMRSYLGYKLNKYYSNSFNKKMMTQTLWYRILRKIKRIFFGNRAIFKSFNEAHNN